MRGRGHRRGCIIYGEGEGKVERAKARVSARARSSASTRRTACKHAAELHASTQRTRAARRRHAGRTREGNRGEGKNCGRSTRRSESCDVDCGSTDDTVARGTFSETRFCRHSLHPLLVFLLSRRVHQNCQSTSANSGPQEGGPCGAYVVRRPVFAPVKNPSAM